MAHGPDEGFHTASGLGIPQSPSEGLDHHRKARVWEMVPEEPGTVS